MRQIKEILRLKHQHQLSVREIGRSTGLPSSTVNDYLVRAQKAGLSWPLPEDLCDQQIQQLLLNPEQSSPRPPRRRNPHHAHCPTGLKCTRNWDVVP